MKKFLEWFHGKTEIQRSYILWYIVIILFVLICNNLLVQFSFDIIYKREIIRIENDIKKMEKQIDKLERNIFK